MRVDLRAGTPGATPPGSINGTPRVIQAEGGLLNESTLHDSMTPFEQEDHVRPTAGIHDPAVSPSRVVDIPVSSFVVPSKMTLLIYDFEPNVYRFSGVDPNDYIPVESQRFAGQMGWHVMVSGKSIGNLAFNLVPRAATSAAPQSQGGPITAYALARARSNSGLGVATLPQRPRRVGALNTPYTLVVHESESFTASARIFRPIQSPVAFFSFNFSGFLVPAKQAARMMEKLKPTL